MPGLLDFIRDPESQKRVGRGLLDAANRGLVANTLGGPVDMATALANLGVAGVGYAGHKAGLLKTPPDLIDPATVPGSSEWIGKKMERAGMVSQDRNPVAEAGFSMLAPVAYKGAQKAGGLLFNAEQKAAQNLAQPSTMRQAGQRGVIDFGSGATRDEKRQIIRQMAEDAAQRFRANGFDAKVEHSGSAAGPSSYLSIFDPQTGRSIKYPLRFSDHSKGPFNAQFVNEVSSADDIDLFVKMADDMRALGPSDYMRSTQLAAQSAAAKKAATMQLRYDRAVMKRDAGEPLSNSERSAIEWFEGLKAP